MKKNDSPEKILELLKNARNIALFTHSRPDGDAIGSTLALKSALERMGKKAFAFCDTEIGHKYDSLGFGKFFFGHSARKFRFVCSFRLRRQRQAGGFVGVFSKTDKHAQYRPPLLAYFLF